MTMQNALAGNMATVELNLPVCLALYPATFSQLGPFNLQNVLNGAWIAHIFCGPLVVQHHMATDKVLNSVCVAAGSIVRMH